jgi:hypothetical protein
LPPRRRWKPLPLPCWCCRRRGARPAITAEVGARRVAYVCQACAADEALVGAFAVRQLAEHGGKSLIFRRLPFIQRTVFDIVFADYPRTTIEGSVVATPPGDKASSGDR